MPPFTLATLPVLFTIEHHKVHDLRAVVGNDETIPIHELSATAYGTPSSAEWLDVLQSAPRVLTPEGAVRETWKTAALAAARVLADGQGDESIETWLAWLALELGAWPTAS